MDLAAQATHRARRTPDVLALVLISGALLLTVAQVIGDATDYGVRGTWFLSLENEGGPAERYGQLLAVASVVVLVRGWRVSRSLPALAWAFMWLYIAADDALQIHESAGNAVAQAIGSLGPLEAKETGELVFMLAAGSALLGAVIIAEMRTPDRPTLVSRRVFGPAVLYGTFAVILDVLLPDVPYGIAIEDGGELVALVLVLMASLSWYRALNASGPTASGP